MPEDEIGMMELQQDHRASSPAAEAAFSEMEIAVIIPCYNEETAIPSVIRSFKKELPSASIYVYDNNSSDKTREVAAENGAIVRCETLQGKGNVVRRMFSDVEADIYVLADGDDTYEAAAVKDMIDKLIDGPLDMVTGQRIEQNRNAYRPGHRFGNWMFTTLVATFFGLRTEDMLSGYRVMSRRFVKSFPALSQGFEIETELTVHALELRLPICDHPTKYIDRPPGSESKLNAIRDGLRISRMIVRLLRAERPMLFFSVLGSLAIAAGIILVIPVVLEFIETGLVRRFPTAILAGLLELSGLLSFAAGMILESVTLGRREMRRLSYSSYPATVRRSVASSKTKG